MLSINHEKAIKIAQEAIRKWRELEFSKNDIDIQNALVDGLDLTPFIEKRNWLRDLPQKCEAKTVEELRIFLIELGVI
jgi:hypothetical protein